MTCKYHTSGYITVAPRLNGWLLPEPEKGDVLFARSAILVNLSNGANEIWVTPLMFHLLSTRQDTEAVLQSLRIIGKIKEPIFTDPTFNVMENSRHDYVDDFKISAREQYTVPFIPMKA